MAEQWLQAGHRIDERFELTAPYSEALSPYGVEVWKATDSVLARELRAIIIPSDHPYRARTIDAARKAGLFEDPQITAVLCVSDNAIFTEFPLGKPLSTYLSDEPLPEPVVTAIIGEAATAINHARHRGLRHLQLSAQHFYLSDSGEFLLDGVAILPALAGVDTDRMSEDLDRDEARGLLVLYAALLEGKDFPSDPSEHQGYIERAAARSDLPQRIQNLFAAELTEASPKSAADILRRIVPWGDISMELLPACEEPVSAYDNDSYGSDDDSDSDQNELEAHQDGNISESSLNEDVFDTFNDKPDTSPSPIAHLDASGSEEDSGELSSEDTDEVDALDNSNGSNHQDDKVHSSSPMFYTEPIIKSKGASLTVSSIVMIVFALLVLLALVIGVSQLFSPLDPVTVTPHEDPAPAQTEESGDAGDSSTPHNIVIPTIASVSFVPANSSLKDDPDAARLFEDAAKAGDSNPDTEFRSWYFVDPALSENDQFGLLIKLEQETDISKVTLTTTGKGGTVQLRKATADAPMNGDIIAETSVATTTEFVADTPVTAQYLTIWVRELPRDNNGENLLRIIDINVS